MEGPAPDSVDFAKERAVVRTFRADFHKDFNSNPKTNVKKQRGAKQLKVIACNATGARPRFH